MNTISAKETLSRSEALIAQGVSKFRLPPSGSVVVGASGGKDSTFLALLLKHLGYAVQCLTVDLQYPGFEAGQIRENLIKLRLDAEICDLRNELREETFSPPVRDKLVANFRELDAEACETPCGACSRNKRIALADYAIRHGVAFVALGHHREDFLATLLKDYFVHNYYKVHGAYDSARFSQFLRDCPIIEHDLVQLCLAGEAGTMAVSLPLGRGVSLIRPMVFVPEQDIIKVRDSLPIPVFSSGCSHSIFASPHAEPTKRELVHVELTNRVRTDPDLPNRLLPIMLSTLSGTGQTLSNPRKNRSARLPGFAD